MTTSRKPHARRIRAAREDRQLSIYAAAKAAGIPWSTWSNYEKRGAMPPLDVASRIAAVLGVSTDWIANGVSHNVS